MSIAEYVSSASLFRVACHDVKELPDYNGYHVIRTLLQSFWSCRVVRVNCEHGQILPAYISSVWFMCEYHSIELLGDVIEGSGSLWYFMAGNGRDRHSQRGIAELK